MKNTTHYILLIFATIISFSSCQLCAQTPTNIATFKDKAEAGDATGQYLLGACYENGEGVPKDMVEAAKWYRKAADQGDAHAQLSLGTCYDIGKGVQKDMVEAAKWYRKAADQGDAISQYLIGACYDSGTGVPKDCVVAYKWILLAGGQGYELAKKGIDLMEARMTREQIAEGQKMAREFVPTKGGK